MKDKALDALEGLQELNENELYYKSENGMLFSFNLDQIVIVLKQALQSNVSEEELEFLHLWASRGVSNELKKRTRIARRVTNPETKNLYKMLLNDLRSDYKKILKYISVFDGKRYPNAMVEIKKPQPTLEELKQSIIDRLNEISIYEWTYNDELNRFEPVNFSDGDGVFLILQNNELDLAGFDMLPLDLAHDITKFFMYSDEVKR